MTIFSPCRSQYGIRSGTRAIVPSSFMISQTTPGRVQAREPREVDRSLGLAGALEDAAVAARAAGRRGPAGRGRAGSEVGSIATWIVCERSCAEIPVETPSRASMETVNAVPNGVSFCSVIWPQPELVAALLGEAEADEPARVGGHEVDRLGRRELGRDRQVALVLAILVVDDDDELALRGCPRSPPRSWRTGVRSDAASVVIVPRIVAGEQPLDVLGEHVDLQVDRVARARARRASSPRACAGSSATSKPVSVERGDRQRDALDRDRALLDAVAEQLGGRVDRDPRRRRPRRRPQRPCRRRRRVPGRSGRRAARPPAAPARR